jgi:tetratricopeptide (TPR) repeat protein
VRECDEKSELLVIAESERLKREFTDIEVKGILFKRAICLLHLQREQASLEALDLTKIICECRHAEPLVHRQLFLLIYFDLHMYDNIADLLEQLKDAGQEQFGSTTWYWTAALLYFRRKGGNSKKANTALEKAMDINPLVLRVLTKFCPDKGSASEEWSMLLDAFPYEASAKQYLNLFAQYWHRTKGAVKWVRSMGKNIFETQATSSAGGPRSNKDLMVPHFLNCHLCKKGKGVTIQMCGQCRHVGYCSKECQKKDWKDHKKECKRKMKQESKTGISK